MNMTKALQEQIISRAHELGLTDIGIIRAEAMDGYMERVRERIGKLPDGEAAYGWIKGLRDTHPWAKSVIAVAVSTAHYKVPPEIDGTIGKLYQHDTRVGSSTEHMALNAFDEYLKSLDIHADQDNVMGCRHAAVEAGLGIIRRNNFFYGSDGSNYALRAWATDADMEYKIKTDLPPCPENCDRCIGACPTGSLSAPYTMNMPTCVSRLTANGTTLLANEDPMNKQIGDWIYGCDACQDVCRFNADKRKNAEDYPGLAGRVPYLAPLKILEMSYAEIEEILMPQFFYLRQSDLWKWKVNALNALANAWHDGYADVVRAAFDDTDECVRAKARYVFARDYLSR
jgi:epoxyqueuosine reductase